MKTWMTVLIVLGFVQFASGVVCAVGTPPSMVATAEEQAMLTPQEALEILKMGNEDYVAGRLTVRNHPERIRAAVGGQFPQSVVLSCMDSRVPVEDVFHRGLGDIFVLRVAGNVVNSDMLGSLEYACKASGAKMIVVLGHEHCGAIQSAIKGVELGNVTELLEKIQPAIISARENFGGDASAKNPDFENAVCEQNIRLALQNIREGSPILAQMETDGTIGMIGAVYEMETGTVRWLEEPENHNHP